MSSVLIIIYTVLVIVSYKHKYNIRIKTKDSHCLDNDYVTGISNGGLVCRFVWLYFVMYKLLKIST